MSRSQGLERFLGCLNGWFCESALHPALNATRGTFTIERQCELHCHSAPSVPRPHPFTATRHRTYRSHCHSALNVMRSTFTVDWQCELHCHSAPSVLGHLAIISVSILRAGSRPRLYRSLGIKRQANRTVGALRPRSHVLTGQAILFSGGWELEHRR